MQIEDYEKAKDEMHERWEASSDLAPVLSIAVFLPRQTLTPPCGRMLDIIDGTTRSMCLGRQA